MSKGIERKCHLKFYFLIAFDLMLLTLKFCFTK